MWVVIPFEQKHFGYPGTNCSGGLATCDVGRFWVLTSFPQPLPVRNTRQCHRRRDQLKKPAVPQCQGTAGMISRGHRGCYPDDAHGHEFCREGKRAKLKRFPKEFFERGSFYVLRPRREGCTVHTRILGASDRIPKWFGSELLKQVVIKVGGPGVNEVRPRNSCLSRSSDLPKIRAFG